SPHNSSSLEREEGELLPDVLPGVIIDAMEATLALGYRYLWADQLCIDQNNREEVADQVGKMDKIYRCAVLTIVSVSERGGLPGTTSLERTESPIVDMEHTSFFVAKLEPIVDIQNSIWFTRGWCYQEEMLSRRILYFTESGALFKCSSMLCHEVIAGPELLEEPGTSFVSPSFISTKGRQNSKSLLDKCLSGDSDPSSTVSTARRIIEEFSKKKLSFDVDSLNAVTGVLSMFGSLPLPVRFCQGLPISETVLCQFDNGVFLDSLCWFHLEPTSAFRRDHLPSWSWAGWNGMISW
ncbi:heterokaryon incompatibility protein-domain-containing protein, partial [Cercophora samala]